MEQILATFKALSDEVRLRTVLLLLEKEACVCELMEVFGMAQSKLSHHLILLRDAGILLDEKRGKWNYYSINKKLLTPANRDILDYLAKQLLNDKIYLNDLHKLNRQIKCSPK
ncbi:MAG: helix-turn-helix transcriptional regulator [Ignavibacteriales bacterium]|nr:helix-turn-helix transcriptional regulator [Ignavibacteriales bacterium]